MGEKELNKTEKAILLLAQHIERCPFCDYKVVEEVMAELGYEKSPTTHYNK